MKPQTRATLDMLRRHPEGCTSLDALDEIGSFRLGARIHELREMGYAIRSEIVVTPRGKHISRYYLEAAA